ncbi:MAG: hypothetical protein CMF51_01990 [Legionellales bacterium]|nr:hypothetical protein [Legionellales bacterium]
MKRAKRSFKIDALTYLRFAAASVDVPTNHGGGTESNNNADFFLDPRFGLLQPKDVLEDLWYCHLDALIAEASMEEFVQYPVAFILAVSQDDERVRLVHHILDRLTYYWSRQTTKGSLIPRPDACKRAMDEWTKPYDQTEGHLALDEMDNRLDELQEILRKDTLLWISTGSAMHKRWEEVHSPRLNTVHEEEIIHLDGRMWGGSGGIEEMLKSTWSLLQTSFLRKSISNLINDLEEQEIEFSVLRHSGNHSLVVCHNREKFSETYDTTPSEHFRNILLESFLEIFGCTPNITVTESAENGRFPPVHGEGDPHTINADQNSNYHKTLSFLEDARSTTKQWLRQLRWSWGVIAEPFRFGDEPIPQPFIIDTINMSRYCWSPTGVETTEARTREDVLKGFSRAMRMTTLQNLVFGEIMMNYAHEIKMLGGDEMVFTTRSDLPRLLKAIDLCTVTHWCSTLYNSPYEPRWWIRRTDGLSIGGETETEKAALKQKKQEYITQHNKGRIFRSFNFLDF